MLADTAFVVIGTGEAGTTVNVSVDGKGDTTDSPVLICGTGKPNATIQILDNDTVVGETTVLADGTFCVEVVLGEAEHTVTAVQVNGNTTLTSPVSFTVTSGGGGGDGGDGGGGNGGGGNGGGGNGGGGNGGGGALAVASRRR